MELEFKIKDELIKLKDNCYINGGLDRDMVDKYANRVRSYKNYGYNVRIHELVVEMLYERLNKLNGNVL